MVTTDERLFTEMAFHRPCRNSFKPVTRFTVTVYNSIYTLHASVNSYRQSGCLCHVTTEHLMSVE